MHDRSYDRAPVELGAESQITPSAFINRVFGWMTFGLAITAIASYGIACSSMQDLVIEHRGLTMVLVIVDILLVIGLSASIQKISSAVAGFIFILYAALNGVVLSGIFLAYEPNAIYSAFFTTSLMFGGAGAYGFLTGKDLSKIGGILGMAVWGLIVAMLVNIFWTNSALSLLISIAGVVIFTGLTAWDMQKIKSLSFDVTESDIDTETRKKVAIIGALELYLDFINLFLYLLRLFGGRRR